MSGNSRRELRSLSRKLSEIMKRLEIIEAAVMLESPQLSAVVRGLESGLQLYREPLIFVERIGVLRKLMKNKDIAKDEISRTIAISLALRGPLNISQITEIVKAERGKASRRIIRERLKKMETKGLVSRATGWGHVYRLAE